MNPKTAVLYARVSSSSQAEEEVSIPAQLDAGRKRAARDGTTLVREFVDEGRSAFIESNRRQFEAAIDYATTHGVDVFYTWSSSRFARNKLEAVKYKRELERAGVAMVYLSVNIDLRTDEGWLLDSIFEVLDEQRSRDTSKDTRRSLIHLAQQGFWVSGLAPFGYESVPAPADPRRRKLVPKVGEAERAREVFELRAVGLGAKAIADHFNAAGIRFRNRPWTKAAVLDLLRNRVLIGQTIFNRREPRTGRARPESEWLVLDTHEAIIPGELWQAVQSVMDDAAAPHVGKGRTRSGHLFTGLIRCGACGGAMTIETARGRGGIYSYYSCRTAKQGGGCSVSRYPADRVDSVLGSEIVRQVLSPSLLREFAEEMTRIAAQASATRGERMQRIASQAAALRQRNARLYEILELHGKDAPNLADLTQRLRDNSAELRALDAEAARIEAETESTAAVAPIDFESLAAELVDMLLHPADPARVRTFYAGFIRSITIRDDTATIDYDPARVVMTTTPGVHSLKNWGRWRSMRRTLVVRGVLQAQRGVSRAG